MGLCFEQQTIFKHNWILDWIVKTIHCKEDKYKGRITGHFTSLCATARRVREVATPWNLQVPTQAHISAPSGWTPPPLPQKTDDGRLWTVNGRVKIQAQRSGRRYRWCSVLHQAITTIRRDFTAQVLLCFPRCQPEGGSKRGQRWQHTSAVGLLVQNPVSGRMVKTTTARQCSRLFIVLHRLSCHSTTLRPYLWGRWCRIITRIGSVGAALPVATLVWVPLRFLVAVLVREPRAEWCELTTQPFHDTERNGNIFAHQTNWKLNRS